MSAATVQPEVKQPPVQIKPPAPIPQRLEYVRFTRLNRTLHVTMGVSFIFLALTGLSLKFSYTAWAVKLAHLLGGFQTAGFIHRLSAIVMFGTFGAHLIDVLRIKRREHMSWMKLIFGPGSMMFNLQDLKEFLASFKWFVGAGPRPRYGRWTYWEKFDYFAVFWGMVVIGFSGLTLWFPIAFTRFLPGWFINVATIVHSDEALLAVVFIFTVHFFNTHMRPEKFPMDTVIFTGQMTLEELKRDKPREYEELVASGKLRECLAEPQQPIVIKAYRVFGWFMLTMGFAIVVWTIYALVSG
ncbi:MAG TPA: hypothetical protein VJA94_05775 [Candidatus Angelobacter sp.]